MTFSSEFGAFLQLRAILFQQQILHCMLGTGNFRPDLFFSTTLNIRAGQQNWGEIGPNKVFANSLTVFDAKLLSQGV